ncbi:MAG: SGNH/GDSL hydrolase family protein [Gammaproteobacteria bacterium]|nr:SGNH/GDSL hydrolase family protein [Gammaproteobacteria bacterium]
MKIGLRILLAIILSSALMGLLAITYFFYQKAFLPLHKTRLAPLGLSYYTDTMATQFSHPVVLFFGDSRALEWPKPKTEKYTFINRGIASQTSAQVVWRFQAHVAPLKPDVVVIQVCINDLKVIPLFSKQTNSIINNCKKNIAKIVEYAHEIDGKVILSTVFPLGNVSILRKAIGIREAPIIKAIDEVNTFIRSLASEQTHILDSYQLLVEDTRKIDKKFSRDWLHLNRLGYRRLNERLSKLL